MKIIFQMFLLLSVFGSASADVIVRGEQTENRFLRFHETDAGFRILECAGSVEQHSCKPMFPADVLFSRDELRQLRGQKANHAVYAVLGDLVMIGGLTYLAFEGMALAISKKWILGGVSLDGGAAALPIIGSGLGGSVLATSVVMAVDALDPFVHLDILKTYDIILQEKIASKKELIEDFDLKDVEGRSFKDGYVLTIEDIDYTQLRLSYLTRHLEIKGLAKSL